MTYVIEHTDTFGGGANYSWVRRAKIAPRRRELTRRGLVRVAKRFAGLTGVPCRVVDHGDMIEIWPRRICHVVFITWDDSPDARGIREEA